jgi:hypothetical protein
VVKDLDYGLWVVCVSILLPAAWGKVDTSLNVDARVGTCVDLALQDFVFTLNAV